MARGGGLTQRAVEAAKPLAKRYRLQDRNGLLLEVRATGSKAWLCRVTVAGRRRDMGLGDYPTVSLAAARARAIEMKRQARAGLDPGNERERVAAALLAAEAARRDADARTFRAVAAGCIAAQTPGWKNGRTADLWRTSLALHAFPDLGAMPVATVDRAAVLRAILPVWTTRPATARKVLRRIGTVLRFAAAHGWRANDNPADARVLRLAGLPALPAGRSHPALAARAGLRGDAGGHGGHGAAGPAVRHPDRMSLRRGARCPLVRTGL